ncbi:GNAT family N-acetyltransferase [Paraflavitalea sp. CAU 1676]|uniref:GNAT family N-acetyltransferase n=1 Tax=Paraflavitalea sp. CAU 1676 TaxID=3032598 RepID=UPI0023D99DB8|nr:GNAT family N-acetyltransferase [Paraflavitalea sp. CAU 1676]MDF2190869.1 GNAT family N-acetyltransferase [Paraflavitalea sp. CAU 1676]
MPPYLKEYQRLFPDTFELETQRVKLRLLTPADFDALYPLAQSRETWKYFVQELDDAQALRNWIDDLLTERAQGKRVPFVVIDKDTKTICGSTSYLNISFFDKRLEIGSSWLGPDYIGMGINKQAKFALLSYAFGVMKMERVEIKTDNLNERAKAALLKVGMIPEGVLRSHMQMHHDRRRDSIYFSMLKNEWPERAASFFPEMMY